MRVLSRLPLFLCSPSPHSRPSDPAWVRPERCGCKDTYVRSSSCCKSLCVFACGGPFVRVAATSSLRTPGRSSAFIGFMSHRSCVGFGTQELRSALLASFASSPGPEPKTPVLLLRHTAPRSQFEAQVWAEEQWMRNMCGRWRRLVCGLLSGRRLLRPSSRR